MSDPEDCNMSAVVSKSPYKDLIFDVIDVYYPLCITLGMIGNIASVVVWQSPR